MCHDLFPILLEYLRFFRLREEAVDQFMHHRMNGRIATDRKGMGESSDSPTNIAYNVFFKPSNLCDSGHFFQNILPNRCPLLLNPIHQSLHVLRTGLLSFQIWMPNQMLIISRPPLENYFG